MKEINTKKRKKKSSLSSNDYLITRIFDGNFEERSSRLAVHHQILTYFVAGKLWLKI